MTNARIKSKLKNFDFIKPDFILVAAGIGSGSMHYISIKTFKCACIDCGYIVDALSDISFCKKEFTI